MYDLDATSARKAYIERAGARDGSEDPRDQAQSRESSWHVECFRLGLVLSGVLRIARGQLVSQCVARVTPDARAAARKQEATRICNDRLEEATK